MDFYDVLLAKQLGGGGSSLTDDVKEALLNCFEHVAWIDDDGQIYYDALKDTLYPPANLVSISAVYTQSGTVYDTDTLDSLKSDLVVTAHYDDSTSEIITDCTLSGTLTVGTSTITVTYKEKTTTFNVVVSTNVLYKLATPTVFNGTSDYIDTGFALFEEDRDYTIVWDADEIDFDFTSGVNRYVLWSTYVGTSGKNVFYQAYKDTNGNNFTHYQLILFDNSKNKYQISGISSSSNMHLRGAISHIKGSSTFSAKIMVGDATTTISNTAYNYQETDVEMCLGLSNISEARFFKGSINEFVVYDYAMTQAEIEDYVDGGNA